MPVHSIHHFNIRTSKAEVLALRDFYCEVVGLIEGPRPPFRTEGFWLYAEERAVLHLTVASNKDALPALQDRRSAANHIAFKCSDLETVLSKLDQFGVVYSIDQVPQLSEVQLFFRDPSGVSVELNFDAGIESK